MAKVKEALDQRDNELLDRKYREEQYAKRSEYDKQITSPRPWDTTSAWDRNPLED